MLFKKGLKNKLPIEQSRPVYPLAHMHAYPPTLLFMHVALFLHNAVSRSHGSAFLF